ncbi:hypothetical protein [Methanobrevibacter sp.]|jgi:hypothetical protein|uniref:hypothetical protein n=1 Tax=Methanobrevibacter sp. TaxID=66852 RepID=UPI00386AACF7
MAVQRYNLAQIIYEDKQITTDTFKTTRKLDNEEYTASNSYNPYAVNLSKETFEWEMSDIDPQFRAYFDEMMDKQKANPSDLATIATYDYNPDTGDIVQDDVYDDAYITEISKENANKPFTVKGGALRKI